MAMSAARISSGMPSPRRAAERGEEIDGIPYERVLPLLSGANDVIADKFMISLNAMTWAGRLGMVILPATFGAGIYQISQLVDTFFATSLPQGSLTLLKMADRLNQMPLGVFGIALGTAILPMLSRHIHTGDAREAQRLQANAFQRRAHFGQG